MEKKGRKPSQLNSEGGKPHATFSMPQPLLSHAYPDENVTATSQVRSPFNKHYNQVLLMGVAPYAFLQQANLLPPANRVGQLTAFPFFTFSKYLEQEKKNTFY